MKARIFSAFLLAAGLLCGAAPVIAQPVGLAPLFTPALHYDYDDAGYWYCSLTGVNNLVASAPRPGLNRVKTAGASTTITSFTTSSGSMQGLAVGDVLYFNVRNVGAGDVYGTPATRVVVAAASADSITVDEAIDLTNGAAYNWRKSVCDDDSTVNIGAYPVDDWRTITFQIMATQENSASIDYLIQCRNRGYAPIGGTNTWADVHGPINRTGTFNDIVSTIVHYGECRVGIKVNTDDGGDTGANAERISILVSGLR